MYAERESVEVIVHYCTVCMDDIHLVYGAMFVLFIEHKQKQKKHQNECKRCGVWRLWPKSYTLTVQRNGYNFWRKVLRVA